MIMAISRGENSSDKHFAVAECEPSTYDAPCYISYGSYGAYHP